MSHTAWVVVIHPQARRELNAIEKRDRARVHRAILAMERDPHAGDVRYLGAELHWRRRVGDWRIFFELDEAKRLVFVAQIKRRSSTTY
jgi:mRNA-degrading endonuclease RelE of RelBE toxin-antitoxin system